MYIYQSIFSTSFLVVWVAGSLLSRDINQSREFISLNIIGTAMSKENLRRVKKRSYMSKSIIYNMMKR